ncbi:MAG: SEL1-like repeat protein [Nitrospira sp.]|nr:SEL1-like repeat protein [Nitrospira sp.]
MAKKGYPGLVLVPPSDRTILRRRLLRWALFIIALIWCASTLPLWPPASDDRANCPPGVGREESNSFAENCSQPQPVTEPPPNQSEFSLTPVSQAESLGESQNPPPSPTPDPDRLATQHNRDHDSQPKSSGPTDRPSGHNVAPPANEKSTSNPPAPKLAQYPDVDARLAERGDAFAQYRLGRYYAQRDGRQAPESVSWYKKASSGLHRLAETGNGQAMYVLGVMYAYGRGVARDTKQARRWLTQAVEHKIMAAQPVLTSLGENHNADPKSQASAQDKR